MPTDLGDLLPGAAGAPTEPIDVDELWARGRRRRRWRHVSAAAGGLASVALIAVAITSVDLGGPATPEVAPLGTDDADEEAGDEAPEVSEEETDASTTEARDEQAAAEGERESLATDGQQELERELDEQRLEEQEGAEAAEADDTAADEGPAPSEAALADPCAGSADRQGEAFIEVVGPVDGEVVEGPIELVGCASVYEGTVRYRLLSGDDVLVDSFTTATYGGPELGEFQESIPVEVSGPLTLQVFWDSPADGSEQNMVEVDLEAR